MLKLIEFLSLAALIASTVVLAITAVPTLWGGELLGMRLMAHMSASGVMVFSLPVVAMLWLRRSIGATTIRQASSAQTFGYWLTIVAGIVTIGTMFACMMPIASTELMHSLVTIHSYAGFTMVVAVVVFAISVLRLRRMKAIRSTTPG